MARLAIRHEINSSIKPAIRQRFVAIITIEFLSVYRRNVRGKMPLVIEPQHIRIARVNAVELKFRVLTGERIKRLGETLWRSRQIKGNLLLRARMSILRGQSQRHSFLGRGGHDIRAIVAGGALRTGNDSQCVGPTMFLVAGGARPILNHIRFMECVLFVARFALSIDRLERDAPPKAIGQRRSHTPGKCCALVVARTAVLSDRGVTRGNFPGVEKRFAPAFLESKNCDQSADDGERADDDTRATPRMQITIVTEVAFVALGDLLLRASGLGHAR